MKPAQDWRAELASVTPGADIALMEGRGGDPTLKVGSVFLHSRYRPVEEAARLIESAELDLERPVLVVGLGLGYHVLELLKRGADVAVVEPDPGVAKLALEGPMRGADVLLGVGDPDDIASTDAFRTLAGRCPQVLIHPPTARIHSEFAEAINERMSRAALSSQRLSIAVVGPMFGGSLPIAKYLADAFQRLGHRSLLVGNDVAWPLYQGISGSVRNKHARDQLSGLASNLLNEWCYARVAEFHADICIVIAQAPVNRQFPARLMKEGIVTAFWFMENWRHMAYWKDIAPFYDYFFHIQPGEFERKLDERGCRHHAHVQTACDPEVHKPVELDDADKEKYGCGVSFAGAGYHNRIQMFLGLTDYDFKIWGVDWHARELQPLVCDPGERFTPERFAKIVAGSKINLNLHASMTHNGVDPKSDAINPRVFEIAACGGFQVCDPAVGLEQYFDFGTELPVYRNLGELRKLLDHYLAHPDEREAVAKGARERVLREHTYEDRARQMLELLLEHYGARILRKGVRVQRTLAETAELVGKDTPLGAYLAEQPPDKLFTQETMNELITTARSELTYPEAVFAYMREVRNFTELLLAEREQ